MRPLVFHKMHGRGNDFVIVDLRWQSWAPVPLQLSRIADRRRGVGCDQVVIISPPSVEGADADIKFFNADGSVTGACGNGTRCAGSLLIEALATRSVTLNAGKRRLTVTLEADGTYATDMGVPSFDWQSIPLAHASDTDHIDIRFNGLTGGSAVNLGNPHLVFLVDDAERASVEEAGAYYERHPLFPERTNVEFISILGKDKLRMRVWERGVGLTQACGSGACAAVAAAHRRGICGKNAEIIADGGSLRVTWRDDGHMILAGPVTRSFTGQFDPLTL